MPFATCTVILQNGYAMMHLVGQNRQDATRNSMRL